MKPKKHFLTANLIVLTLFGIGFFGSTNPVSAQVAPNPVACTSLSYNLRIGMYDGVAVTSLQTFLQQNGFLLHVPTGYFGPLTFRAVQSFQARESIITTGFVGPLTRAAIQALTCGKNQNSTPTVFDVTPANGPIGTQVTLTGRWFTADNTVYFGGEQIGHLASSGGVAIACTTDPSCIPGIRQAITFIVPSSLSPYCAPGMYCAQYVRQVNPGTYPIYITNTNGMSNTVNFVVTGDTSNVPISISGIDAPNSLPIGTPGNWTVHVLNDQTTNLHYSVVWGDEKMVYIVPPPASPTSSSSTFSHVYSYAGNYTATFTVTDDFGHSANASSSIRITPLY